MNLFKIMVVATTLYITSFSINKAIVLDSSINAYSKNVYGPFTKKSEDQIMTFSYVAGDAYSTSNMFEQIAVYNGDVASANLIYKEQNTSHKIIANEEYIFTLNFYPSIVFENTSSATVVISIHQGPSNRSRKSIQMTIKEYKETIINDSDRRQIVYLKGYYLYFNTTADFEVGETFYLTDLIDTFSKDTYYRLPIEEFKIPVSSPTKITQNWARLYFDDKLGLFPYLRTDLDGRIFLPLKIYNENDYIYWKPDTLYVQPDTFYIVEVGLQGFVPCNSFFFPHNTFGLFDSMDFIIHAEGVGASKVTLDFTITLYPTKKILGDCTKDEYCIVGGVNYG